MMNDIAEVKGTDSVDFLEGKVIGMVATVERRLGNQITELGDEVLTQYQTLSRTLHSIESRLGQIEADQNNAVRRLASDRVTLTEHEIELERGRGKDRRKALLQGGAVSTAATLLLYVLAKLVFGIDLP
jgi:hypothetical protein